MRAAVLTKPGCIVLESQPDPAPADGEVLIAVRHAGLCGSDLHFFDGSNPLPHLPQILGHEVAGEIIAVGASVRGRRAGERVVVEPGVACGRCFACRRGKYNCCDEIDMVGVTRAGGFAEFLRVPESYVHVLPSGMSYSQGALVEPFSIGAQILHRAQPRADDIIVVIGLGAIGLTVIILLKAWHPGVRVVGVDLVRERLAQAKSFGCDELVDPREQDVAAAIRGLTGGDGAAIVIDCAGSPGSIGQTVQLVASGGRVVIAGVTHKDVSFPGRTLTKKEVEIFGSRNNAGQFPRCIEFLSQHPAIAQRFVSAVMPLEQIEKAISWAREKPQEVTKILFQLG